MYRILTAVPNTNVIVLRRACTECKDAAKKTAPERVYARAAKGITRCDLHRAKG